MSESELIDRNTIQKNRLRKKIDKLLKQRDHWKDQYDKIHHMIKLFPVIQHDYNRYERDVQKRQEHEALSKRVKEQEMLIRVLLKDDTLRVYEIQEAYRNIIAERNRELNELMKKV